MARGPPVHASGFAGLAPQRISAVLERRAGCGICHLSEDLPVHAEPNGCWTACRVALVVQGYIGLTATPYGRMSAWRPDVRWNRRC